jgi:hypothetical protein
MRWSSGFGSLIGFRRGVVRNGGAHMVRHVRPSHQEFKVLENEVIHKPTNASWTAYPGQAEPFLFRRSILGSVLPNGDDYREQEVVEMALDLLKERLKK